MRTYSTIRCPHCREVLEKSSYGGGIQPKRYGCPIRTCQFCKKEYYDERYEEPALKPLKWYIKREPSDTVRHIFIFFIVIPLVVLIGILLYFEFGDSSSDLIIVCLPLIAIFVISYVLGVIYSYTHLNIHVDNEFVQTYYESEVRLKDARYIEFLRNKGVKIKK